jgi:hypothetical protein
MTQDLEHPLTVLLVGGRTSSLGGGELSSFFGYISIWKRNCWGISPAVNAVYYAVGFLELLNPRGGAQTRPRNETSRGPLWKKLSTERADFKWNTD